MPNRKNGLDIQVLEETERELFSKATASYFPLFTKNLSNEGSMACEKFDFKAFSNSLKSKKLGKLIIYTDVITSTQLVLER